jgi:glycine cleavage system aminomethyltransferase T
MAEDTWQTEERPILEAGRDGEIAGQMLDSSTASAAAAGLDDEGGGWCVQELVREGYLRGVVGAGGTTYDTFIDLRLTEKGRRAVGQWPAGTVDAFFAELERLVAHEKNPDQRRRLERWLEAGREAAPEIVGAAIVVGAEVAMGL